MLARKKKGFVEDAASELFDEQMGHEFCPRYIISGLFLDDCDHWFVSSLQSDENLARIKAEKNSSKLKNKIRQILYLIYKNNKITKALYE